MRKVDRVHRLPDRKLLDLRTEVFGFPRITSCFLLAPQMYTPLVVVSRSAFDRVSFYLCIGYVYVYITADEEYLSSHPITTPRLLNSHTLRWHQELGHEG